MAGGSDWRSSQPMGARGCAGQPGSCHLGEAWAGFPHCCSRSRPPAGEVGGYRTQEQVRELGAEL